MNNELADYAESLGFGDIHFKFDKKTGLRAIIAIHSTKNGPALGGCRCIEYGSVNEAIRDALHLARAMSYKSAVLNLELGGGKAVLIKPQHIPDRQAYFQEFGRFVADLGGRYITAVDSGTTMGDMAVVRQQTEHVRSCYDEDNSPSPYTARGVLHGIEAAVAFKLGKSSLAGIHVAIQGLGEVGYDLCKKLHQQGATLTVADINSAAAQACATEFAATVVSPQDIFSVRCDVFAPCALGNAINEKTIEQLQTSIVAGAANNQLANSVIDQQLHTKNILYAPDFVINAGGLIKVSEEGGPEEYEQGSARAKIRTIYDTLLNIFEQAQTTNTPTQQIACILAEERL